MLFRTACFLAAFAVTTLPSAAQGEKEERGDQGPPPGIRLELPVTGLTAENAPRVEKGLAALTLRGFVCPVCDHGRLEAGDCKSCQVGLEAGQIRLVKEVEVSVGEAAVECRLARVAAIRLSEIETVLRRAGVGLEGASVPLPGPATLVFRGGSDDGVAVVRRTLTEAGLYGAVRVSEHAATGEVLAHVNRGRGGAPTRGKVAAAFSARPTSPQLVDVEWGPASASPGAAGSPEEKQPPKARRGKKQGKGGKGQKEKGERKRREKKGGEGGG
jgi:hypothetical protein